MTASDLPANYRYWREHGQEWPDIYDFRKKHQVMYHLQEIMLADYMARQAPGRVLEYGCGFGRHLSYLSKIDGLDVYGYDQSRSMAAGALRWAGPEWARDHIATGEPVGQLPYAAHSFDIVFTVESLVHVRPADLPTILSELLRLGRSQIYHLETAPDYQLFGDAHDGCWYHDFVVAYAQLGYPCEILPRGYSAHLAYRVRLNDSPPVHYGSELLAKQLRRLEADIQATLDTGEATAGSAESLGELVATLQGQVGEQQRRAVDLENRFAAAQAEARDQIQKLTNDLAGTRDQLDTKQTEFAGVRDQFQAVQQELMSTRDQLDTTQTELAGVRDQLQSVQRELMSTRDQLDTTQTELAGVRDQFQSVQRELMGTRDQLRAAQIQLAGSHEELRTTQSQLTAVRSELESASQHSSEIAARYAAFLQQLDTALKETSA